jgi:hypothetical protein
VKTISNWPREQCIDKLDCRREFITLLDLALVAKLVHDHDSMYRLFKCQCFWYADTVSAVLETSFPGVRAENRSSVVEAHHAENAEGEIFDEVSGTFMRVPIHKPRQALVDEIVETFRQRRVVVDAQVCFFQ